MNICKGFAIQAYHHYSSKPQRTFFFLYSNFNMSIILAWGPVLPRVFPIKFPHQNLGKSVKGFQSYDRTSKQTEKPRLLLYPGN